MKKNSNKFIAPSSKPCDVAARLTRLEVLLAETVRQFGGIDPEVALDAHGRLFTALVDAHAAFRTLRDAAPKPRKRGSKPVVTVTHAGAACA